jgi:hypothetical protein
MDREQRAPGVQRIDDGTLFSNPILTPRPVIPPPAPIASQPPPVSVSQSVPQAEWTDECSTALDALIALRIPRKKAIDLVRRAAGNTHDEILRAALRIDGQSRTQSITGSVNGHAVGTNTPAEVTPANAMPIHSFACSHQSLSDIVTSSDIKQTEKSSAQRPWFCDHSLANHLTLVAKSY